MSNLSFFEFRSSRVRTTVTNGEIAFCLIDVLAAMGSKSDITQVKASIKEGLGDDTVIKGLVPDALGREQETLFILETGLTFLLSRSRTEIGKQLNRHIHCEVLPSIKKTGMFGIDKLSRREILQLALDAEDRAIELEQAKIAAEKERLVLQAQIEQDEPATTLGKAIAKAPNNIRIGDFAKSIGMGQNRYFNELRDDGIIQQTSTLPYQQHISAGLFVVTQVIGCNGRTYPAALITPKGQIYLAKRHSKYISRETIRDAIECHVVAIV